MRRRQIAEHKSKNQEQIDREALIRRALVREASLEALPQEPLLPPPKMEKMISRFPTLALLDNRELGKQIRYGDLPHQRGGAYGHHRRTLGEVKRAKVEVNLWKQDKMARENAVRLSKVVVPDGANKTRPKHLRVNTDSDPCEEDPSEEQASPEPPEEHATGGAEEHSGRVSQGEFICLPSPRIELTGDIVKEIPMQALQPGQGMECRQFQGNPPGRRVSTFAMNAAKSFNEQQNPLDPETDFLAEATQIAKRRIEECRRRWWRYADKAGQCNYQAFTKLLRSLGVQDRHQCDVFEQLFKMLDVQCEGKLGFEQFMRACAVFRMGGDKVSKGYANFTQTLIGEDAPSPAGREKLSLRAEPHLKRRDVIKAKVRMCLNRYFYSEVPKEEKRAANFQVNTMMEMLQEHLDPPEEVNQEEEEDGTGDQE